MHVAASEGTAAEAGKTVVLRVERDGKARDVTVRLRRLV